MINRHLKIPWERMAQRRVKINVKLLFPNLLLFRYYFRFHLTVQREQSMKRENQKVATIRCLLLTSVSTCFGHHYAHLQENKGPVTVFCV